MRARDAARHLATVILGCTSQVMCAADHAVGMPDGEETAVLQLLNGYRSDWAAGDARIMAAVRTQEIPTHEWEWNNVVVTSGASAPLVFNASLNAIAHELLEQHLTLTARKRYDAAEVLHGHGYSPDQPNLVMLGSDAPSLMIAFELAVTNAIGEIPAAAGTTAPVFARAEMVQGVFREAGIAIAHGKGTVSALIILAAGSAPRYVGGIVFLDGNRDHHYAPTEGGAGVRVACGLSTMVTGPSGAWWLALDNTLAHHVIFTSADHTHEFAVDAGAANQECCWRMPMAADGKSALRLMADAEKASSGTSQKQRLARLKLLMATRMAMLDDTQQARLDALTIDVREEFLASVHTVKASLTGEPEDITSSVHAVTKLFGNIAPSWVHAAKQFVDTHADVTTYLATPPDHQESMKPAILGEVASSLATAGDPTFLEEYLLWLEQIDRPTFDALGPLIPEAWCVSPIPEANPHPH